jgi:hypothetical protein
MLPENLDQNGMRCSERTDVVATNVTSVTVTWPKH